MPDEFPKDPLRYALCFLGIVLFAWVIARLLKTSRSTQFTLPAIVQVCIVIIGAFVSQFIALYTMAFLAAIGFFDHDPAYLAVYWILLVGGIGGSILLACVREKKGKEEPNQALLPTTTAVTPPAGQESRQP